MILAAVAAPPTGTYVYAISLAGTSLGTSQIVVNHADGGTTITETATINGQAISTVAVYEDPVQFKSLDVAVGGRPVLRAAATVSGVDFSGAAQMHFDIAHASRAFVDDGLAEALVVLPAALASGSADVSFVTTVYPRVIPFAIALSPAVPPTVAPTATAPPSHFGSRDVTFTSKDGSVLAGTISYPDGVGPFPCVILLQGSGISDRNETVGPNPIFAELADALNARGYAVLRYDKRGTGASTSAVPLMKVVRDDPVADGVAAVAFVGNASRIDAKRIYFLGHSEGGELVMGIALAGAPVRGIIMLAPLPMNYTAMIERQIAREHVSPAEQSQLRAAEKAAYVESFNDVDPVDEVRQVRQPMLLVHGSNDPNVTDDDLRAFIAAAEAAHPRTFSDVELSGDSHLFAQISKSDAAAGVDLETRVALDPRLVGTITAWLASP